MNIQIALQKFVEFSEKSESACFDVFFYETKGLIYKLTKKGISKEIKSNMTKITVSSSMIEKKFFKCIGPPPLRI